ncbi:unnamed protein product [Ectocarpus sp. 12 AP-2014]
MDAALTSTSLSRSSSTAPRNCPSLAPLAPPRPPIPFDTCQQYQATDNTCDAIGKCKTCWNFDEECAAVESFPNATVAEYGTVSGEADIMAEVFARGPVACEIDASPLRDYTGGVIDIPDVSAETDHIVAIAGWGETREGDKFWVVRNSWGEYWGEGGWFRLKRGENQLLLESNCAWAVPGSWTELQPHHHHDHPDDPEHPDGPFGPTDPRDPPANMGPRDPPDKMDPRDPPDKTDPRDPRANTDPRDPPDKMDPRDPPDETDLRDPRANTDPREPPANMDPLDPPANTDPRDPPANMDDPSSTPSLDPMARLGHALPVRPDMVSNPTAVPCARRQDPRHTLLERHHRDDELLRTMYGHHPYGKTPVQVLTSPSRLKPSTQTPAGSDGPPGSPKGPPSGSRPGKMNPRHRINPQCWLYFPADLRPVKLELTEMRKLPATDRWLSATTLTYTPRFFLSRARRVHQDPPAKTDLRARMDPRDPLANMGPQDPPDNMDPPAKMGPRDPPDNMDPRDPQDPLDNMANMAPLVKMCPRDPPDNMDPRALTVRQDPRVPTTILRTPPKIPTGLDPVPPVS